MSQAPLVRPVHRDEARHGLAGVRDADLLAEGHSAEQLGEISLGLPDINARHCASVSFSNKLSAPD